MDKLTGKALERYKDKLALIGLETCPFKLPGDLWQTNPKEWPSLHYHELYQYLIKHPRKYINDI